MTIGLPSRIPPSALAVFCNSTATEQASVHDDRQIRHRALEIVSSGDDFDADLARALMCFRMTPSEISAPAPPASFPLMT